MFPLAFPWLRRWRGRKPELKTCVSVAADGSSEKSHWKLPLCPVMMWALWEDAAGVWDGPSELLGDLQPKEEGEGGVVFIHFRGGLSLCSHLELGKWRLFSKKPEDTGFPCVSLGLVPRHRRCPGVTRHFAKKSTF